MPEEIEFINMEKRINRMPNRIIFIRATTLFYYDSIPVAKITLGPCWTLAPESRLLIMSTIAHRAPSRRRRAPDLLSALSHAPHDLLTLFFANPDESTLPIEVRDELFIGDTRRHDSVTS